MKKILSAFMLSITTAALLFGCAADNRAPGATPLLPDVAPIITPSPNIGITPKVRPNQEQDLERDMNNGAVNGGESGTGGGAAR
ncbi:MAG: hypothetical protein WDA65_04445 [Christensenellales bacterium]